MQDQDDGLWLALLFGTLLGVLLYLVSGHDLNKLLQRLLTEFFE